MTEVDVPLAAERTGLIDRISMRRLQAGSWTVLLAIAVVRVWLTRYFMNGDAIAYLDIARMIAGGHPGAAVNGHWSPGYPALISLFLWAFHPGIYWESTLVHLVNVVIFAGALAAFQLFWGEARLWHVGHAKRAGMEIHKHAFWAFGYSLFAIAVLNVVTVAFAGPDLPVAALCCFAGWSVLRFRRIPSVGHTLLLGAAPAVGYYVKAPFFLMGIVFILCACLGRSVPRRRLFSAGLALLVFLLLCAPYIAALSRAKGRLTFGDSARLNYALFIDGVQKFQHWQGGPAGAGMPVHPTRKLNDVPQIYEFAASDMGTYPPWFDISYWYEGITPHLRWILQTKVFLANLAVELQIIMSLAAMPVVAGLALALFAGRCAKLGQTWFVWGPGLAALLMFAVVHVEPRYIGGWLILLLGGAVCACFLPPNGSASRAVQGIALAVLLASTTALVAEASQEAMGKGYAAISNPSATRIATFLLNNGLRPGDRVAVIGDGVDSSYWAHLAQLQIVAEIPANLWAPYAHPALDFWESSPEDQQKALRILEQTGARAVIAGSQDSMLAAVPSIVPEPWNKIAGSWADVYLFHEKP